ncbi:hypothetical protein Fmac_011709 [Flemingia macrophylla]|uniref:Uncharacterized protein n=1 Tax=Flemingia macrophylla TaxID=520843 RepID=A0ABD1MP11_9FABA
MAVVLSTIHLTAVKRVASIDKFIQVEVSTYSTIGDVIQYRNSHGIDCFNIEYVLNMKVWLVFLRKSVGSDVRNEVRILLRSSHC